MAEVLSLQTTVDTYVTTTQPGRYGSDRLYVTTTAESYLYFTMPTLPTGAQVISAKLQLYAFGNLLTDTAGFPTVTVHRLTSKFDANGVTWATRPTYFATALDTETAATNSANGYWEFDVTTYINSVINGADWYGFRLSSNSTQDDYFSKPLTRLTITYASPPRTPTELSPRNDDIVMLAKPVLTWNYVAGSGSDRPYAFQVQVDNAVDMVGAFDTGTILSQSSVLDLATTAYPGLAAGSRAYWRVRVQNDAGLWSDWATPVPFRYAVPGTLTITTATPTGDPTPDITWTFSGATQAAYQIIIQTGGKVYHDSGIKYGTTLTYEAPQGIWDYNGDIYEVEVRVWDTASKTAASSTTAYVSKKKLITFLPGGTAPPVEIEAINNAPWPIFNVNWRYTGTTPAFFNVYRYRDDDPRPVLVASLTPAQASYPARGANWYTALDWWVPGRSTIKWFVQAVTGGVASTVEVYATTVVRNPYPWVMSNFYGKEMSFALVNYSIDPGLTEVSEVVQPLSGQPFLVTQSLKGYVGQATGELANDIGAGMTAQQMRKNFLFLRSHPRVIIVWLDEAIDAYIYNMDITPLADQGGKTRYLVSFGFVQVGGGTT